MDTQKIANAVKGIPPFLLLLLCLTLMMDIGFYIMVPYISIHFTHSIGLTTSLVGIIMAVRLLTQKGTTFFGGVLSDRFGVKIMMVLGCLLRGIGFLSFGYATSFFTLCIASAIAGIGGTLFSPAIKSALVSLTPTEELRKKVFSIVNITDNAAMMVGPLCGLWLMQFDFRIVSTVSASLYILVGLLVPFLFKNQPQINRRNDIAEKENLLIRNFSKIVKNKPFLKLILVTTGYYFTSTQVYMLIPITAQKFGNNQLAGTAFTLISVIIIFAQIPIDRLCQNFQLEKQRGIFSSFLVAALLTCPSVLFLSSISLYIFVIGVAVSMILFTPNYNVIVSEFADDRSVASYFGFSSYSSAIGGALGNIGSGFLMEAADRWHMPFVPWLLILCFNLACAAGVYWCFIRGGKAAQYQQDVFM